MAGRIKISYQELCTARTDLKSVSDAMNNISSFADAICSQIGNPNPDFRHEIREFDKSWDDNRADIIKAADAMHDVTDKFLKDWEDFDRKCQQSLQGGQGGHGGGGHGSQGGHGSTSPAAHHGGPGKGPALQSDSGAGVPPHAGTERGGYASGTGESAGSASGSTAGSAGSGDGAGNGSGNGTEQPGDACVVPHQHIRTADGSTEYTPLPESGHPDEKGNPTGDALEQDFGDTGYRSREDDYFAKNNFKNTSRWLGSFAPKVMKAL